MARKILNTGIIANDGTGDRLRNAFDAVQANTAELYGFLGGDELSSLKARERLNVPSVEDVDAKLIDKAEKEYVDSVAANEKDLAIAESKENINTVRSEVFDKFLQKFNTRIPGYFLAMLDASNYFTDLSIAQDGQVAEFVMNRWRNRINDKNGMEFTSNDQYLLALIDKNRLMTDLTIDKSGQFADFVVERLANRVSPYLDITPSNELKPIEYTLDENGSPIPLRPNLNKISLWGSSSAAGLHTSFEQMAQGLGISDIYLGGKGGENIEQIAGRFGAHPAKLKFKNGVIPKSGAAEVTVDWATERLMRAYTGIVNGVHGTFSVNETTLLHYFTRTTAGEAITVNPETEYPFIPDASSYRDGVVIMNAGKNNLTDASNNQPNYVMQYLDEMVKFLLPINKYVLVLGHFVDTDSNSYSKNRVLTFNELCKEKYSDLYFDLQSYVMSSQIWLDAKITPTQTDLEYQAKGEKPPSLSKDTQHLNDIASQAVVNQIKQKLIQLRWYK